MILQALAEYYDRLVDERKTPALGFQDKEIPFLIVLSTDGTLVDLVDTRTGEGRSKRARRFVVPREVKRSGKNAWQKANLLWDNEGYVLGFSSENPARAEKQHRSFLEALHSAFPEACDPGVAAVVRFLESGDFSGVFGHPLWAEVAEKGGNISFQLQEETCLVCERPKVRDRIARAAASEGEETTAERECLISGEPDIPARLHAAIKGVRGSNTSGANIVSFNLSAFSSFGKEKSYNAPVGKKAEFAYTTALNTLLSRDSAQRLPVGDATVVFWAERKHEMENAFADFFGDPPKGATVQDHKQVITLYRSPQSGTRPELAPGVRFFVLGLAPNAARIAVRFWYAGTVGEVAANIGRHFDDLEIVVPQKWSPHLPLRTLLKAIALRGDLENVPPNVCGDMMKSILAGTPYPRTLLASALRRIRAERDVTYPKAALVKAILVRDARFYKSTLKEVDMSLDASNTNIGYRLGRLFALLEKIQEEASPGINATIRDRFYGAASSAPVAAFSHLMKLKNHHLAKLENRGRAVNLERIIGEVMDGISDFPRHLSLQDQGRFAVGYYHQRQNLYKKQATTSSN